MKILIELLAVVVLYWTVRLAVSDGMKAAYKWMRLQNGQHSNVN